MPIFKVPGSLTDRGRRARGLAQMRGLEPSGETPGLVVDAVRRALWGRAAPEESAWIDRIELLRRLLLTSPERLEIVDYGAGEDSRFDTGEVAQPLHVVTRTLGAMTQVSKRPRSAYLLFRLVRELRPQSAIELGSCVGVSACYQASALELNQQGRLVTMEGAPALAERSKRSIQELGLSHRATVVEGRFTDTLPSVLDAQRPVSYAFIDGHHMETATIEYMDAVCGAADSEAVLVFDDINWSDGMRRAWSTISNDPRFALTADLGTLGIAVISESASSRANIRVPYA